MTTEIKLIGRIHRPGEVQPRPYKEPPRIRPRKDDSWLVPVALVIGLISIATVML